MSSAENTIKEQEVKYCDEHYKVVETMAAIKRDIKYLCDKVDKLLTIVEGNGTNGLNERVSKIEWRNNIANWISVAVALGIIAYLVDKKIIPFLFGG